jgi:hypothetical protein
VHGVRIVAGCDILTACSPITVGLLLLFVVLWPYSCPPPPEEATTFLRTLAFKWKDSPDPYEFVDSYKNKKYGSFFSGFQDAKVFFFLICFAYNLPCVHFYINVDNQTSVNTVL